MKKLKLTLLVIVLILVIGTIAYAVLVPSIVHPVLKSYGPVYDLSFAAEKPDTTIPYKIVADLGWVNEKPVEKPGEMLPALQHIARMYNLHIYGGVQQKNLEVAVVIWGDPIGVILNNEAYHKKYGVDNPNIKIISEMKQAGVKFMACGQSMVKYGIDPEKVNPDVSVALSRFTAVSTCQMKGFAYFKF